APSASKLPHGARCALESAMFPNVGWVASTCAQISAKSHDRSASIRECRLRISRTSVLTSAIRSRPIGQMQVIFRWPAACSALEGSDSYQGGDDMGHTSRRVHRTIVAGLSLWASALLAGCGGG